MASETQQVRRHAPVEDLFALAAGSLFVSFSLFLLKEQVLLGQSDPFERTLFWRFDANQQAAVCQGEWKYLKMADQEHLFNLAVDARERAELKEKYPEKFEELRQLFADWHGKMLPYQDGNFSEDVRKSHADWY